jgi:hypothetical protein
LRACFPEIAVTLLIAISKEHRLPTIAAQAAAADGAAWLNKNPDKALPSFALGNTYRFQTPAWYLMWGDKNRFM